MNIGNRATRYSEDGEKKNRDSLTLQPPHRRYGAGHVPELLRVHRKKLDDEQVGRGLNEVCAGCNSRWGWINETAGATGARSTKQVD